jgi:hypothetical protein
MSLVVLISSVQLGFAEGYANRRSASNPLYSAKLSTGADTLLRIRAPRAATAVSTQAVFNRLMYFIAADEYEIRHQSQRQTPVLSVVEVSV